MNSIQAIDLDSGAPVTLSRLDKFLYRLSGWYPCRRFVSRYLLLMPDVPDEDGLGWLERTIAWDKAHPVRYRLWRIYIVGTHPIQLFKDQVTRPLRRFWQRGRKGWCYEDVWAVDDYLARIVPELLDALRHDNHGWPGEPMTFEEWNGDGGLIDQMANGFRAHTALSCVAYVDHSTGERYDHDRHEPIVGGLELQFEEGMALFAKHFGNLWD